MRYLNAISFPLFMIVAKTGGYSVSTLDKIREIADIVEKNDISILVSSVPKGITDSIYDLLKGGSADPVRAKYSSIVNGTLLSSTIPDELEDRIRKVKDLKEDREGWAHYILGEPFFCEKILAPLLGENMDVSYIDPLGKIFATENRIGQGENKLRSYEALRRMDTKGLVVFPGFVADDGNGVPMTIARGGSDTFGAVIAAALDAECYHNYTNQDGIRVVSPDLIEDAGFIDAITYAEYTSLAYRNFKVLDSSVIPYLEEAMVPTVVKNHERPEAKGTMMLNYRKHDGSPVTAIANNSGYNIINLYKPEMGIEVGFLHDVLGIVRDYGVSIDHLPAERDEISLVFEDKQIDDYGINDMMRRFHKELGLGREQMYLRGGISLIVTVGQNMRDNIGVSKRASSALADAGVNIIIKDQGASQHTMLYGVADSDVRKGVQALYREFF